MHIVYYTDKIIETTTTKAHGFDHLPRVMNKWSMKDKLYCLLSLHERVVFLYFFFAQQANLHTQQFTKFLLVLSSYNRTTAPTLGVFLILWQNNLHTQLYTKFLPVLSSYNRTIALTLAVFLILWWNPEKGKQSASTPTCRLYGAMTAMSCGASPACTSCSTWAATMSASPVNTHSVTVARPPQCLPLLSTHTAVQWQGLHNVCLSCQHTQRYSDKAPTMSASPVNTHSCTVARPPQCLPLLSTHTAVQWQAQSETKLRDHLMTVHPVKRFPDKRPPWQTTLMKYYLSLTWWGTNLIKDHPDERLPEFNLARDHPDKRPHWQETTQMRDHPDESTLMKDYLNSPWWWTILTNDHTGERPPR